MQALQDSAFVKDGSTFNVSATAHRTGGIPLVSKGNRYIHKIHFLKFLKAAHGPNTSNAALALLLDVDASTIPRLQETCAGIFMVSQLNTVSKRALILDSLI